MNPSAAALDVLVIGAGPAGAATALALRQAGVAAVGLIQPPAPLRQPQRFRLSESAGPDLPALLAALGLAVPPGHRLNLGQGAAWDGPLRWDSFAQRQLPPAWQVDRERFDQQLLDHALQSGATLFCGHLCEAPRQRKGHWQLGIGGRDAGWRTQRLRSRLLVDASGRRSVLARQLGAQRLQIDRQIAVAADLQSPTPQPLLDALQRQLMIEAEAAGWWYATLRPDGPPLLSLMSDHDLLRDLQAPAQWMNRLRRSRYLSTLTEGMSPPSRLHRFAADSACLDRAAGDGWLAVGDALMTLDPLSASGLNGALRDAIDATEQVLLPWLRHSERVGPATRWGQRANRSWQQFLHQRQRSYAGAGQLHQSPYWKRRSELPQPPQGQRRH